MIEETIARARQCLDNDDKLGAAKQLAALGQHLEKEGAPGAAWSVYQLAHEHGANAGPAMARLSSAGAKIDNTYLRETRRRILGFEFPQPELARVQELRQWLNLMWDVSKESLIWMSTFEDEQLANTPWPVEGYQRLRELIVPPDAEGDIVSTGQIMDDIPRGEEIWRRHAPVGVIWAYLELTRGRFSDCEDLYRVFRTIGGLGSKLYRRLSLARDGLKGHEANTVVKLVGQDKASQQAAFAALWMWDKLQPEKPTDPWALRAAHYATDPALIVLTGMYGTVLQKIEGVVRLKMT